MADQRMFDINSRPRVYVNWDSFVAQGIPTSWQWPFVDAVVNAYTRWMTVAGAACRFRFEGFTTKTNADAGEVVISMNERHFNESRLASAFGSTGGMIIVFHRKNGANLTDWPFVPYNASPGEYDMQAILMHELGHTYWLDHSSNPQDVMWGNYSYHYRFGPYEQDVQRVKALYGDFAENRLRLFRSSNGGSTWISTPTAITSYNHYHARTTSNAGVAPVGSLGLYALQWSHPNRIPTWLRNDGVNFLFTPWWYYGGERAVLGHAVASDDAGTLLWAWVTNDNALPIRLVGSTNAGASWYSLTPPAGAASTGTPGLAFTRVNGVGTWVMVWSHFDRSDHGGTTRLLASLSTNGGFSWSTPVVLDSFYRVLSGVTVAAAPDNRVLVAFAWADNSNYGTNLIRVLRCSVSGGALTEQGVMYGTNRTRIQPAVAYHPQSNRFLLAFREQNYLTSLDVASAAWGDSVWSAAQQLPNSSTNVAPVIACSPVINDTCLWYAYEGA